MNLTQDFSYRHKPLSSGFMYCTVKERLKYFADTTPSKLACVVYDSNDIENRTAITCSELYAKSRTFANGLLKLGIKQGDVIAVSLPNGPLWMVSTFGIQLAGAVPLLFSFYRQDGSDIINALRKSENCSAMILNPGTDELNWKICRNYFQDISPDGIVKCQEVPTLKYVISTQNLKNDKEFTTFDTILNLGSADANTELPHLDPDDVAAILLTSGSTGTPKAVQCTHINVLEVAHQIVDTCGMDENDIYINGNVFNWIGGYPHIFLFKGTTRVTCSNLLSFKSLAAINTFFERAVKDEKATVGVISVPGILELAKHVDQNNDWARSLKIILTGGLPIPAACSKILDVIAEKFMVYYGASEMGMMSVLEIKRGDFHEDYSIGIPVPGTEMKVVDDYGKLLPPNQVGEIYARHCCNHLGYHNDKTKTEQVFLPTGWYKTDDVGCMRENGTFVVSGRKSDVIIVGGELVSPAYLESIIQKHPGVQEVVIVAVPDENMFQQACSCIIPRPGHVLSEKYMDEFFRNEFTLIPACRGLAPKYYLFFDAFPKTALGKTSRIQTRVIALERLQLNKI